MDYRTYIESVHIICDLYYSPQCADKIVAQELGVSRFDSLS